VVKGSYEFVDITLIKELEQRLEVREEKVGKMVFKVCRRCGIRKPILQFTTDKRNTNGRASICKKCRTIESLVYYYENKQKLLIKHKRYRDNHKGDRTKYFQDYQENHKEHLQKVAQKWYKKNRQRIKEERLKLKVNLK
jgi:ribosomal protein L40E